MEWGVVLYAWVVSLGVRACSANWLCHLELGLEVLCGSGSYGCAHYEFFFFMRALSTFPPLCV